MAEEAIEHKWGFSILPVTYDELLGPGVSALIAVGLCHRCYLAVTNSLPFDFDPTKSLLHYIPNIPKFGCVSPFAGL